MESGSAEELTAFSEIGGGSSNEEDSTEKTEKDAVSSKEQECDPQPKTTLREKKKRLPGRRSTKKRTGKSDPYFIALFWLFLISRVWSYSWVLQFVPILISIYLAKALIVWLNVPEIILHRYTHFTGKYKLWIDQRRDAIVPGPVRGIYRLLLKGDKKVQNCLLTSALSLMLLLLAYHMILVRIVASAVATIFLKISFVDFITD